MFFLQFGFLDRAVWNFGQGDFLGIIFALIFRFGHELGLFVRMSFGLVFFFGSTAGQETGGQAKAKRANCIYYNNVLFLIFIVFMSCQNRRFADPAYLIKSI